MSDAYAYVLPLADSQASLTVAGGKGASLAHLAAAGLPVPGGFHVTTAAYREFVTDNDLQANILAAVQVANVAQPATLDVAAGTIHDLFLRAAMPSPIAEAIARAYAGLGQEDGNAAVAVRSSATAEDLPGLSFAGQQETYLNVRGREAVLAAVQQCWASLWTARAIGYRHQHAVDQEGLGLAVVVQRLVCAEAAGVLFTANPVTSQRAEAMLTATWGLGEAIVGGLVTPDTLSVEKATGRVLKRETADKQVMTVRVEGGTREQPTPAHLRRAPVLNDAAAGELVRLGVQIEKLYGQPMDIEWARAEGKFAILQARPITALPLPELTVPPDWKLPHKGTFMRGSIIDFMPEPLSPLFATLGRSRYNLSFQRLIEWFARDPKMRMFSLVTINGYGYMSVDMDLRSTLRIIAVVTRLPQLVRLAVPRWRDQAVPRYDETVARWQARSLASLSAAELLTGIYEIVDAAMDHLTTLQGGIMGIAGAAEAAFAGVYDRLIRRAGDPGSATFVLGYDSAPILADKGLYDLAGWCRQPLGLAEYVEGTPAAQLAADLASPQAPGGMEIPAWRELQTRWQAHLERHGAMFYSLDFARSLPAEEPAPLLETLKLYLSGRGTNPYERQRKLAARREAAVQSTLARLRGWRLKLFRTVLGWAQAVAPLREDGIAYLGHGYPQLRRMLLELGRRLAQAGAVQQPDDIFWLIESEVRAAAATLDQGQTIALLKPTIQQRQAEWQAQKRLTPPPTLPPMKKFLGINIEQWLPASGEDQMGNTLKGVPASPGQITASACVLHGPEDFDQMRPGSVLVAEITTPAWTPLFAMASAVVTDIGGPLSHGSIVAREYGLPAVMGTGVATRRIHSGQMITVDGSAGVITLPKN